MEKFATARKMKDRDFAGADIAGLTADEITRLCPRLGSWKLKKMKERSD